MDNLQQPLSKIDSTLNNSTINDELSKNKIETEVNESVDNISHDEDNVDDENEVKLDNNIIKNNDIVEASENDSDMDSLFK